MQPKAPTLSYEPPMRPNPWAKPALVAGIILLAGSVVPVCGLAVIPLARLGVIAGVIGTSLAVRGKRRGLAMSVSGAVLCLAAAFIPIGMLGTVPFLAELGLKHWASKQNAPTPGPAPATAATTMPAPATGPASN